MKEKQFDCVKMKHEIQARLLKEMAGLSLEERQKRTEDRIQANPILARLWRQARQIEPTGEVLQESR